MPTPRRCTRVAVAVSPTMREPHSMWLSNLPTRRRHFLIMIVAIPIATLVHPQRLTAQSGADKPTDTLVFNHKGCSDTSGVCNVSYHLDLKDGESFAVYIDSTQSDNFVYDIAGFVIASPSTQGRQRTDYDTKVLTQKHDKRYGGYLVTIRRKAGAASKLPDASLLISVSTRSWALAFGGGYSISSLVDHVYAVHDTMVDGAAQKVVARENDHQDWVRPGTATFIHAYPSNWTNWALTFGLGVGESASASYFLGPSYRFGDVGAVTFGAVIGPQKDLPAGTRVGQVTTDPNAIGNLVSRTRVGLFMAASYSFLSSGQSDFQKPVKGTDGQSASTATAGANPENSAQPASSQAATLTSDQTTGIAPGSTIDFTLEFTDPSAFPAGKFGPVKLSITPDSASKANFSTIPADVEVKPSLDNKSASGKFRVTLANTVSGIVTPTFGFDGSGISVQRSSQALSIKKP
jgi:hypothetical protein